MDIKTNRYQYSVDNFQVKVSVNDAANRNEEVLGGFRLHELPPR